MTGEGVFRHPANPQVQSFAASLPGELLQWYALGVWCRQEEFRGKGWPARLFLTAFLLGPLLMPLCLFFASSILGRLIEYILGISVMEANDDVVTVQEAIWTIRAQLMSVVLGSIALGATLGYLRRGISWLWGVLIGNPIAIYFGLWMYGKTWMTFGRAFCKPRNQDIFAAWFILVPILLMFSALLAGSLREHFDRRTPSAVNRSTGS